MSNTKSNLDNCANQLNPNNPEFAANREVIRHREAVLYILHTGRRPVDYPYRPEDGLDVDAIQLRIKDNIAVMAEDD